MTTATASKTGLESLLTPDNCALILIDHQPFQAANLKNIDVGTMLNNTVGLAKAAKIFNIPTLLTTVLAKRGGDLFRELQAVFPEQEPIDRTFINTWQDSRVVEWVRRTGRKKIVMAALWTEVCLSFPTLQALGEGYEVYIVTDASGGVSVEAHERAIQRMVQAGAVPLTWLVVASELQRDWARTDTLPALTELVIQHGGASGTALAWELQLLGTKAP